MYDNEVFFVGMIIKGVSDEEVDVMCEKYLFKEYLVVCIYLVSG